MPIFTTPEQITAAYIAARLVSVTLLLLFHWALLYHMAFPLERKRAYVIGVACVIGPDTLWLATAGYIAPQVVALTTWLSFMAGGAAIYLADWIDEAHHRAEGEERLRQRLEVLEGERKRGTS